MACVESDYSMFQEESDCDDASFMSDDEENVAPPSNTGSKPKSMLSPNTNIGNVAKKGGNEKKTVEEIYQKKSQLEHILLRPDTYIGSVERLTQEMFVLDPETNRIVNRKITYTPGLFKIFDESKY
jgi:DNA topoisomerase-2